MNLKSLESIVGSLLRVAVASGFGNHLAQHIGAAIKAEEVKLEELPIVGPIIGELFPNLPKQASGPAGPSGAGQEPAPPAGGAAPTTPQSETTGGTGGAAAT